MREFGGLRRRLAEAMEASGEWPERSLWLRDAVEALPRHVFAPDRLWQWTGHAYVPVDRATAPDTWASLVYGGPDDAAVTQLTDGVPSSSLSCQGVVVDMLDSLRVEPGHRVLELGTGTGWNAALLAHRAGPGRVVSVEVDAELAEAARRRLRAAGADVAVRVGDGAAGRPDDGPWDRVIATYAVEEVPWPWVAQTRPGGRLVFPWGRLGHVALTVADDGRSATGWVQGLATFMPARGTPPGADWWHVHDARPHGTERPFRHDVRALRDDAHLLFALRVARPDVHVLPGPAPSPGPSGGEPVVRLHDGAASWAVLTGHVGAAVARQGGPRRLADEVGSAWDWWTAEGSPPLYDFGMTVTPDHSFVWCGGPEAGPVRERPAFPESWTSSAPR
ncbi:methyltransferase domain-containing protein [Streptomyces sp. GSL17-111]|uniref:methyltransferase domain-containing protein n=1 Tax=Streptomyces sp. GSL17-111 TaxID=3121596 RepID=UPI0030F45B20